VVDGVILFFCHLKVSTVHHLFSQILLFVEGDKWKTLPISLHLRAHRKIIVSFVGIVLQVFVQLAGLRKSQRPN
jgi:hypothetical protein